MERRIETAPGESLNMTSDVCQTVSSSRGDAAAESHPCREHCAEPGRSAKTRATDHIADPSSAARQELRPGVVKRREDGQIGIFSFCLPVDISSATGCCQNCWSDAKAQSHDRRSTFPAIHLGAFAPLREVKTGIDEPVRNGLIGIIFFLPASVLSTVSPTQLRRGKVKRCEMGQPEMF
jgi:hypothetical protein